MSDALIDQLRRYADAAGAMVPVRPLPHELGPDHGPARRSLGSRPRPVLLVAAIVVAVALAVGLVAIAGRGGDDRRHRRVTTVTTPKRPARWGPIPPSPLAARTGAAVVSSGREILVWGGEAGDDDVFADGAVYDVAHRRWRTMARSPLSARTDPIAVWTGSRLLVTGGKVPVGHDTSEGDDEHPTDAASYDPVTNRWRLEPSIGALQVTLAGATPATWTDRCLFVVGALRGTGSAPLGRGPACVTQDGRTSQGRSPTDGGSLGFPDPRTEPGYPRRRALWTGRSVIVVSMPKRSGVVIDTYYPGSRSWGTRRISKIDGRTVDSNAVVWSGDRAVIIGHATFGEVYDPVAHREPLIEPSRSRTQWPAVAVSSNVVTVGDRWLDPHDGTWHRAAGLPPGYGDTTMTVAIGGTAYVLGDGSCARTPCPIPTGRLRGITWRPPG